MAGLSRVETLRSLGLHATQVTDLGLTYLKGLRFLEALDVSNTQVTPAGVAELQKTLPDCVIVNGEPMF